MVFELAFLNDKCFDWHLFEELRDEKGESVLETHPREGQVIEALEHRDELVPLDWRKFKSLNADACHSNLEAL